MLERRATLRFNFAAGVEPEGAHVQSLEHSARRGATLGDLEMEIEKRRQVLSDVEREGAWLYAWALVKRQRGSANPPRREGDGAMTTLEADRETTAFLAMAEQLRVALAEREEFMRLFRERYDRAEDDPRRTPGQRVKIAAELLRAAHRADHIYEDRVDHALDEYRVLISADQESRF